MQLDIDNPALNKPAVLNEEKAVKHP